MGFLLYMSMQPHRHSPQNNPQGEAAQKNRMLHDLLPLMVCSFQRNQLCLHLFAHEGTQLGAILLFPQGMCSLLPGVWPVPQQAARVRPAGEELRFHWGQIPAWGNKKKKKKKRSKAEEHDPQTLRKPKQS